MQSLVKCIAAVCMALVFGGCRSSEETLTPAAPPEKIMEACVQACKFTQTTRDISSGPCVLDPVPGDPDWVCDIAHSPRQPIDDLPMNQCEAYREGTSRHFIELTPECTYIQP